MEKFESFIVTTTEDLSKNDVYHFLKASGLSNHYIKNLRKCPDSILLNGKPVGMRQKLSDKDILQILKNPIPSTELVECEGNLDIVFEDDDFLIVNKPHNLACIPTRSHINDNLGGQIAKYLRKEDQNFTLRILNRLDKETAGLVVVAKNVLAYKTKLNKTYYALCHNNFRIKTMTIDKGILTITQNGINQMKRVVSSDGKSAKTHVEVISEKDNITLVKLKLETGRTHQIRVHLSSENHPLVGDSIYGTQDSFNHTFLILKQVDFTHFRTKEHISLEIDFPDDWKSLIKNP